jgi:hypothetical protein
MQIHTICQPDPDPADVLTIGRDPNQWKQSERILWFASEAVDSRTQSQLGRTNQLWNEVGTANRARDLDPENATLAKRAADKKEERDISFSLGWAFLAGAMLRSMSIECQLKGAFWEMHRLRPQSNKDVKSAASSHDLVWLCEKLGVVLDADDEVLLERLKEANQRGRFPITSKGAIMGTANAEDDRMLRDKLAGQINEVLEGLRQKVAE